MRALLAVDAPLRSQLHAALAQKGWRVTTVATGEEALAHFRGAPFPLVILSSRLPDAEWVSVCRSIRDSTLGRAAYLIVTHPTSVAEAVRPLVEVGVDDFIATPVVPSYLVMRLALAEYRLAAHPGGAQGETRTVPYPERIAHLEHALHIEQASLQELFQSTPQGIVAVDQHDYAMRINAEFTRMFGYSAEEAQGRPINELIVPDHLREEGRRVTLGVMQGERITMETVRRHRDGHEIEVALMAIPIQVGGGSIGAYGIYRDITERKAHVRALAESEARYRARSAELESAMQARNRLYSAMSHELRTPISAIMLYQELMLSGAVGELSPEQEQAMQSSHAAAQHLLELVNDVLDLSKIEAGKLPVHPVPVALRDFLDDLLVTVMPLARRHGSEIEVDLSEATPVLMTDPQRLRQILLNLISNAAKFGRGHPIALRCGYDGAETVIEVEDHGVGIAKEDLVHIFEDFVQVGSAQSGGTGLGLAISRRLAALLGGRLEVESELGAGSTFRLLLRSADADAVNAQDATER